MTLDGNGYTITAVDPAGGHFVGAVVANGGTTAHVANLTVTASGLANVCDGGADRLRGIFFEGASGSIMNNVVTGLNQGPSGCQEGNSIEVRNAPYDGTNPNTVTVEVAHNVVADFQKTGILALGDVEVDISNNTVYASATQENLAANSIQVSYGTFGSVELNVVEGNQWKGTSDYAATALLTYLPGTLRVSKNKIAGNSDVGLFILSDNGTYEKNNVTDEGSDDPNSGYDYGIWDDGSDNVWMKTKASGFEIPFYPDPLNGTKNKAL
jgi:hypothetical protein